MRSRSFFAFDILMFGATLALLIIGVMFIYSSGVASTGVVLTKEYLKQIVWVCLGIAILFSLVFSNYSRIGDLSSYIYVALLLLLVLTLFIGRVVNGAKSWIPIFEFGMQPSEFAKIATILFLARFFDRSGGNYKKPFRFAGGFAIVALPMFFILLQPDMGTALVYLPIFLSMSYVAGIRLRYLIYFALISILLVILGVLPAWQLYIAEREIGIVMMLSSTRYGMYAMLVLLSILGLVTFGHFYLKRRYFYWIFYVVSILFLSLGGSFILRFILKDYQIKRLIVFLDPGIDPQGAGWNVIQSVTAVGSGGMWGRGWLKGTQSHYRFLPQQSTDFIFSIIAEEWGFIGGIFIFVLFFIILLRGIVIMLSARDEYATYVAAGIVGMLGFHVFINIGMAMGIMPITGIPLFFLSYGGSSLWTGLIGIGLLLNIHIRRYRYE